MAVEWRRQGGRTWIKNPDTGLYDNAFEAIAVKSVKVDALSGEQKIEISIETSPGEETIMSLPRGALAGPIMPALLNYGLTCSPDDDTTEVVLGILLDTLNNAEKSFFHQRLGFAKIDGEKVFLAHKPVGLKNSNNKVSSTYVNTEETEPIGSYKAWRKGIRTAVLGRPNMELALALSALAPVSHLLREAKTVELLPVIALVGNSSTGKTTALKMIASVYGNSTISSGLVKNVNATVNALFADMNRKSGIPILLDETTGVPGLDFTPLIYYMPTGRDKLRCNGDGSVKAAVTFSGAVFFTGEKTLFNQTSGSAGLRARLVEFEIPWTNNAVHADFLNAVVDRNYGWAVKPLLEFLLKNQAWLAMEYAEQLSHLKENYGAENGIEERLLKIYALILTSAVVMKKALQMDLFVEGIEKVIISNHVKKPPVLPTVESYFQDLKDRLLEEGDHFVSEDMAVAPGNVWGIRSRHEYKPAIFIKKDRFQALVEEVTGRSFEEMRKAFFKAGYIYRSPDRHYTIRKKIGAISADFYVLYTDYEQTTHAKKRVSKSKISKKSNINLLLEDADD